MQLERITNRENLTVNQQIEDSVKVVAKMYDPNNSQDDSSEDEKVLTHSFHKVMPSYSSIRNKPLSLPEAVMKTKQDKTE